MGTLCPESVIQTRGRESGHYTGGNPTSFRAAEGLRSRQTALVSEKGQSSVQTDGVVREKGQSEVPNRPRG